MVEGDPGRALDELAELRAAGALTDAEYTAAKAGVLGRSGASPTAPGPVPTQDAPSIPSPVGLSARRPARWRRTLTALALALVLVAAAVLVVGGFRFFSGGEVFLEATDDPGPQPFTADSGLRFPNVDRAMPTGGTGIPSVSGGTPGLYGGVRNSPECFGAQIVDFLSGEPAKAAAWAAVQGINVEEIAAFVDRLTPAVLLQDTRVTNHGYADGRAAPRQSVLQAGSTVLVDDRGVPRVRCACGNPLLAPEPTGVTPRYQGAPWNGFTESGLSVIVPQENPLDVFSLVDLPTGERFDRPTGSDGATDARTGQVQVRLTWRGVADLDLYVTEPDGFTIYYGAPGSSTNGVLDIDANGGCISAAAGDQVHIENIVWPAGSAPIGRYEAFASLFSECDGPIPAYRLTVIVDGRVVHDQTASFSDPVQSVSFTRG